MTSQGFAVLSKAGKILVGTVSTTERAAKVNWMYVHAGTLALDCANDEEINEHFAALAQARSARLVSVTIEANYGD